MTANDPARDPMLPVDDADESEDRVVPGDGATPGSGERAHVHDDRAGNGHAPAADEGAGEPFGFDAPIRRRDPLTRGALAIIRGYKLAVSPLMPPSCRFVPTCSEYGYEAVAKYGIITGGRLAIWRILRCNPFGRGGYDPVP